VVYAAIKKIKIDQKAKVVLVQSAGGAKNLKEIMELLIDKKIGGDN